MGRNRKLDEAETIVRWAMQTTKHPVLRIALIAVRAMATGDVLEHPALPAPRYRALSKDDRRQLVELAAHCVNLLVMGQTAERRRRVAKSGKRKAARAKPM